MVGIADPGHDNYDMYGAGINTSIDPGYGGQYYYGNNDGVGYGMGNRYDDPNEYGGGPYTADVGGGPRKRNIQGGGSGGMKEGEEE